MFKTKIYEELDLENNNKVRDFYNYIHADELSSICKGENISIAILDSGVDILHNELLGRLYGWYNAPADNEDMDDKIGHGTYINGIISGKRIGLAIRSKVYMVKVTNDDNDVGISIESVMKGLKWCIDNKIDIVCMPFTNYVYNRELDMLIDICVKEGMILVASTGNDKERIGYPALYENVISVGSIGYLHERSEFSGSGEGIDNVCIGENIPSLYSYNRFATASGSSPSAAIFTALVALLESYHLQQTGRKLTIKELREYIKNNSIDLGEIGYDTQYGYGILSFKNLKENGWRF